MTEQIRLGTLRGTGAAVNVQMGWVPDVVILTNITDGNKQIFSVLGRHVITFTGGNVYPVNGVNTLPQAGDIIVGATSKATARIKEIILDTGTFAGGNATGWIVLDRESIVGTFQAENLYEKSDTAKTTVIVASAADFDPGQQISAASTNNTITAYVGSQGSAAKGFTVPAALSVANKLYNYLAFRNGPGSDGNACANSVALA